MPEINVGDIAPDFELEDQEGKKVHLKDLKGKKNVLLVTFPAAFSPVCTSEMGELKVKQDTILKLDAAILASSVDSKWVEKAFAKELGLKFPVLSDFNKKMLPLYGALIEETGVARRAVFVIDKRGKVVYKRVYEAAQMPDLKEAIDIIKKLD